MLWFSLHPAHTQGAVCVCMCVCVCVVMFVRLCLCFVFFWSAVVMLYLRQGLVCSSSPHSLSISLSPRLFLPPLLSLTPARLPTHSHVQVLAVWEKLAAKMDKNPSNEQLVMKSMMRSGAVVFRAAVYRMCSL